MLMYSSVTLPRSANGGAPHDAVTGQASRPATPTTILTPDKSMILLLERPGLPPISEIAAPEYRVAGIRLDPRTSGGVQDLLLDIGAESTRPGGGVYGRGAEAVFFSFFLERGNSLTSEVVLTSHFTTERRA